MFNYFKKFFLISLFLGVLTSIYGMDADPRDNRYDDRNLNRRILSLLPNNYYHQNNTSSFLKRALRVPPQQATWSDQQNSEGNFEVNNSQGQAMQVEIQPIVPNLNVTRIFGYKIFNDQLPQRSCTIQ